MILLLLLYYFFIMNVVFKIKTITMESMNRILLSIDLQKIELSSCNIDIWLKSIFYSLKFNKMIKFFLRLPIENPLNSVSITFSIFINKNCKFLFVHRTKVDINRCPFHFIVKVISNITTDIIYIIIITYVLLTKRKNSSF